MGHRHTLVISSDIVEVPGHDRILFTKTVFVIISYEFILKVPKSTLQYQILKSRCCFNQENCLVFLWGGNQCILIIYMF